MRYWNVSCHQPQSFSGGQFRRRARLGGPLSARVYCGARQMPRRRDSEADQTSHRYASTHEPMSIAALARRPARAARARNLNLPDGAGVRNGRADFNPWHEARSDIRELIGLSTFCIVTMPKRNGLLCRPIASIGLTRTITSPRRTISSPRQTMTCEPGRRRISERLRPLRFGTGASRRASVGRQAGDLRPDSAITLIERHANGTVLADQRDPPHRPAAGALDAGEQLHLPCPAAAAVVTHAGNLAGRLLLHPAHDHAVASPAWALRQDAGG